MKEKLMERFTWKLSKFSVTNDTTSVLDYRYGELTGILDTMRECNIINKSEYVSLIKLIDYIYSIQQRNNIKRK